MRSASASTLLILSVNSRTRTRSWISCTCSRLITPERIATFSPARHLHTPTSYQVGYSAVSAPSENASDERKHRTTDSSSLVFPLPIPLFAAAWSTRFPHLSKDPTPSVPAKTTGISHIYTSQFNANQTSLGGRVAHCTISSLLCALLSNTRPPPSSPPSSQRSGSNDSLSITTPPSDCLLSGSSIVRSK